MSSSPAKSAPPSSEAEKALEVIRKLSERERTWVLATLDAEQAGDDHLDPELEKELVRRLKKIEDGTAVLLDGRAAVAELRAKFQR